MDQSGQRFVFVDENLVEQIDLAADLVRRPFPIQKDSELPLIAGDDLLDRQDLLLSNGPDVEGTIRPDLEALVAFRLVRQCDAGAFDRDPACPCQILSDRLLFVGCRVERERGPIPR